MGCSGKAGGTGKLSFYIGGEANSFLEMPICLTYMLGGQVLCGPELFSIEYQNDRLTERGIYVYNGYMGYVIRYHKAKRSTNQGFQCSPLFACPSWTYSVQIPCIHSSSYRDVTPRTILLARSWYVAAIAITVPI